MSFGYQVLGFGSGGVAAVANFTYLLVAGGGGNGAFVAAGGGGGFRTTYPGGTEIEVSAGSTITVGAGGSGAASGTNSSIVGTAGLTSSTGGGRGETYFGVSPGGAPGGSGGSSGIATQRCRRRKCRRILSCGRI